MIQPWEYGVLPADWVGRLEHVDQVWTPSECARRFYVESGVDPDRVKVVPNGIDPEQFRPDAPPMELKTKKQFKFLFVGGTIHRKGPDVLLKAFLETFSDKDDVCLVIKDFGGGDVYRGQTIEAEIRAACLKPGAPEIIHLTEDFPADQLAGLYTACDCLVHPYRGEGFGLPVLEAMACGLPVIVTAGGATDDFATDEFAYRIPACKKDFGSKVGGIKLLRSGWLLEPDSAELARQMKWVAAHREEAKAKGTAASKCVHRDWTWEKAAQIADQFLRGLVARQDAESAGPAAGSAKPLALPPAAKVGHLGEAWEQFSQGHLEKAWSLAGDALKVRPFHPEAFLLLAEVAQAAGDTKRARALGERARELAPKWKPAQKFISSSPPRKSAATVLPPLPDGVVKTKGLPTLTVFLITRNEERFLGRCLDSIRSFAHQIIVVDTGSTDWTRDIAARYGAEVYSFPWRDDFSAARNAALERATGDWILMLDADEELMPDQHSVLLKSMQDRKAIAWRLPMVDKGREEEGVNYVPRLFRNAPGLFYVGRVHEQVFSSVEVRRLEWGLENKFGTARLLHHGYTKELIRSRDKIARNLRLLQKALEELPGEPNLLMNLGLELVRAGRLHDGLDQYRAAFRAMSALPDNQVTPEIRETLLTQYCTHLLSEKNFAEIVRVLRSPAAKAADLTATLHWLLGLAWMESQHHLEATEQMRLCLAKRKRPALSPVNKHILKAGPNHCLALCLAALDQKGPADRAFQAALADDPDSRPVHMDYARFLTASGHEVDALKLVHQLIINDPSDAGLWQFGGQVSLSKPEFLEFALDWTGEALKFFPAHPAILEQRGQVLLLAGDTDSALSFWKQLGGGGNPSHRAALLICEALLDKPLQPIPTELVSAVAKEFIVWYRRLLAANASRVIADLNRRLEIFRPIIPAAISMVDQALAEANGAA
jgi:tetratricopeptide (TPR) repeat protein